MKKAMWLCIPIKSGQFLPVVFSFFVFISTATSKPRYIRVSCRTENVLLVTNPKTSETDAFREGSFLVFELKADKSVHEGLIRNITDSSLVFDESQVSLSQINILAGSTKGKIVAGKAATAVGNALLLTSLSLFNCGWNLFIYGDAPYYYWPLGGSIWLAGAFVAGIGYVIDWPGPFFHHTIRVRNYRGWNASIILEEQEGFSKKQILPPQDSVQNKKILPKEEPNKKKKVFGDDVYGE